MRATYTPNERIVGRACELWIQMLSNPKYDNLGNDTQEEPISVLRCRQASSLAEMIPKNNTAEVLERFGVELHKILMAPYTWESDWNGKKETHTTLFNHLDVDYGPSIPLAEAAKLAGLKMEFPWKTSMWLYDDYLGLAYGYGAPAVYHYPLSDGRWLVTKLAGEDLPKILALIESNVIGLNLEAL